MTNKPLKGYWIARKDGCAVYTNEIGQEFAYNSDTLNQAVRFVKNNRQAYLTEEAYQNDVECFTEGLKFLS